ncbi:MAG TPA: DUF998 domain-containing protein [Candidatus Dormibacteraeota bacterium]|nr:DUF998 domain-containing protein [Candidatus Dormibacteraeota bacterium]
MDVERGPGFPAVVKRPIIFGAVCWTLSILFFVGQAVVQSASARPYSLLTNLISDLGNTACGPAVCSPLHVLMNATFILVGLLHWTGAATTRQAWPRKRLQLPVAVLLALAGWGLAYAGLFPENVAPVSHAFGALLGLCSLNAGMIVLGLALMPAARALGGLVLAAGIAGGLGLLLFLTHAFGLPPGLAERVADYPGAAMFGVLGTVLLAKTRRSR